MIWSYDLKYDVQCKNLFLEENGCIKSSKNDLKISSESDFITFDGKNIKNINNIEANSITVGNNLNIKNCIEEKMYEYTTSNNIPTIIYNLQCDVKTSYYLEGKTIIYNRNDDECWIICFEIKIWKKNLNDTIKFDVMKKEIFLELNSSNTDILFNNSNINNFIIYCKGENSKELYFKLFLRKISIN